MKTLQRMQLAAPHTNSMLATTQFLIPTQQRSFGANEKILKTRMKSVNSIRKITKAMKMVATSKMKGDLRRLADGKEFGVNAVEMMFANDQFLKESKPEAQSNPTELLVPITSDKGMCGQTNSGIIRNLKEYVSHRQRDRLSIFCIGEKGTVGVMRPFPDLLKIGISEIQTPYNYPTVMALAEHIIS